MIFFVAYASARGPKKLWKHSIPLDAEYSIEIMGLLPPLLYFWVIYLKGTLTLWDSGALLFFYLGYLWTLNRLPPRDLEEIDEAPLVSRWVLRRGLTGRWIGTLALFAGGGTILYLCAHPFLDSMLALAALLGVSQFVFVQWVSPFLSEFPEKVSAFNWARQVTKAPMALMNMVSSNVNQWTVLAAMIPIVYSWSLGKPGVIPFDTHQKSEILLTMSQAYVGFLLLVNLRFSAYEAIGLFALWLVQFCVPEWREEITWVYWAWFGVELVRAFSHPDRFPAFRYFLPLVRRAVHPQELGR